MNMQNFDNIRSLWQSDMEKGLPDTEKIILQIRNIRKKMIRRYITGAVILVLTFLFIGFIGWYYHFEEWTTRTGIIIILLTIVLGIIFNTRLIRLLWQQSDLTLDNKKFLEQLIRFRNIQSAIKSKGMALYFILLSIGITLYMVEFTRRNIYFGIGAYTITFGWIVFAWVYFHKRKVNKQENEINEQIEYIERMIKGMEEE